MKLVCIVLFIILIFICLIYGNINNEDCLTPTGMYGKCVLISNCEKILSLISGNRADREFIKTFHCGFEGEIPKVCCTRVTATTASPEISTLLMNNITTTKPEEDKDTCYTQEGKAGKCVDIAKCPTHIRTVSELQQQRKWEYIQKTRCNKPGTMEVCCAEPVTKTNHAQTSSRHTNTCQTIGLPDSQSGCCGVDSSSGNKITHGEATSIDQYPWLAFIIYSNPIMCGGSLVNSQYVITAAHCIVTRERNDRGAKSVRLGEYDISTEGQDCVQVEGDGMDCTDGTITYDIAEKIVHPDYNKDKSIMDGNDIALLKLNDTAPYNDFIRPICLPTSDLVTPLRREIRFYVAGWGAIDEKNIKSNVKLHIDVPYVNFKLCERLYSRNKTPIIWNKQLCAGGEQNKDSCKGDSGGPLMHVNEWTYELIGIVSYGFTQCGTKGKPSVYTKVHSYMPWIKSVIVS